MAGENTQAALADGSSPAKQCSLAFEAVSGPCTGMVCSSKAGEELLTVGRTRKSTLHIKDPAVSEWHAEVRWELGRWMLTDVGSSNGTEVNGARLEEGKPAALKDGDIVRFGSDSKLRVQVTSASSEATTVEQHLRADCDTCAQRLKARAEQHANELLNQWKVVKARLVDAA